MKFVRSLSSPGSTQILEYCVSVLRNFYQNSSHSIWGGLECRARHHFPRSTIEEWKGIIVFSLFIVMLFKTLSGLVKTKEISSTRKIWVLVLDVIIFPSANLADFVCPRRLFTQCRLSTTWASKFLHYFSSLPVKIIDSACWFKKGSNYSVFCYYSKFIGLRIVKNSITIKANLFQHIFAG